MKLTRIKIVILIITFLLSAPGIGFNFFKRSAKKELEDAQYLVEQGKIEEAIDAYQSFISRHPRSRLRFRAYLALGKLYYQKGEHSKAVGYFEQVLEQSRRKSERREANYWLARCYFEQKRYEDVIASLKGLYEQFRKPDERAEISRLFFYSYLELERYPEAIFWLGRYAQYAPANEVERAQKQVSELFPRMTESELEQVYKTKGADWVRSRALWELANRAYQDGEFRGAKELFEALLREFPDSPYRKEAGLLLNICEKLIIVKPKRIGLLVPLSGAYKFFGERVLKGALLASQIFQSPDIAPQIELRVVDSGQSGVNLVELVKDMILDDHIIVLVGPILGENALISAEVAQKYSLPMIALSPLENLTSKGEFVFRDCLTKSAQVDAILEWAMDEEGLNKFAVLYPDDKYGSEFAQIFAQKLAEKGGELVKSVPYPAEATDIGNEIERLLSEEWLEFKKEHPEEAEQKEPELEFDCLFIPDSWNKIALIVPQLLFHQISTQLLGTSSWHSVKIFEYCRAEYLEGAVFVDLFAPEAKIEKFDDYQFYYRQLFQEEPSIADLQAYETMSILIDLLEKYQPKSRRELADLIPQIRGWEGPLGEVWVDSAGEFNHHLHIFKIKKGKFVVIH